VLLVGTLLVISMMMVVILFEDVVSQGLIQNEVTSVDDWGYGIKFANWKFDAIKKTLNQDLLKISDKFLEHGCNIVDIGANTGDTPLVLAVAAKGGTVAAFEMGPPVDMLRFNIRLNPQLKIDVHHHAVSNFSGTVLYEPGCERWGCDGGGGLMGAITTNTSSNYQVTSVRLYPFLRDMYSKMFVDNICMVKIDAEGHDSIILSDLDPSFRPRVIWVEWHRRYQFYDYPNHILEDENYCTEDSRNLFNISNSLGYQIFQPRLPLVKVVGCQTKYYEPDILLLKNEFVMQNLNRRIENNKYIWEII